MLAADRANPNAPTAARPKPANLIRSANWQASRLRPANPDPYDISFTVDSNWVPTGFLKCDIRTVPDARHLIFATDEQIDLLRTAHIIWMDGTFKLVKDPIMQLFTVHVFIYDDKEQECKQVHIYCV